MSSAVDSTSSAATRAASSTGTPCAASAAVVCATRSRSVPRNIPGSATVSRVTRTAKKPTVSATRQRSGAVAQQPPARAFDETARLQVHRRLRIGADNAVEHLDVVPQLLLIEDRARRLVRPQDLGRGRARLFCEPECECRAGPVHHAVHQRGRDDLAGKGMGANAVEVDLAQRGGEVAHQLREEVAVVGHRRREHVLFDGDLRVREQHRQLRVREPHPCVATIGERLVVGQVLDGAIQLPALLQRADEPGVNVLHRDRLRPGVGERAVLAIVVAQHQLGDLVGHRREQLVAILDGQLAGTDDIVEQDLDVDLVIGDVDPGAVVDGVGVDHPVRNCILDAAELSEPEVAALADDAAAQIRAVHAHGVVGLVAGIRVAFGTGFDVGADAAVVEQVDGRAQDGADHLGRSQGDDSFRDPEPQPHLGRDRDGLRRAPVHAAARGDERGVVVAPRRAGQLEQALALDPRRLGIGVGVEEQMTVIERGDEPDVM